MCIRDRNITAITGDVTGDLTGAVTGDVTGNLVGTTSTAKNLNPAADSSYNLGSSTVRWTNVYADNLSASANATIAGNCDITTNATVGGTLGVTGVLTASGGVSGNVTGNVTGNASGTAGGLAVTKKVWIGDDLDIGAGDFTVDGPTGNTAIAGTLAVTQASNFAAITASGVAALQSTVNITGGLNINSNKFNVAAATGTTDIAGQLNVVGAIDFDSTLNVDGNADFNAGIDVTAGAATFAGLVQADNTTDSSAYNDAAASVSTDGGLSVAKKAYVGGNFSVGGAAGVKASILAASGNTDIKGTCLLYTSPSPRDLSTSRMPSSA